MRWEGAGRAGPGGRVFGEISPDDIVTRLAPVIHTHAPQSLWFALSVRLQFPVVEQVPRESCKALTPQNFEISPGVCCSVTSCGLPEQQQVSTETYRGEHPYLIPGRGISTGGAPVVPVHIPSPVDRISTRNTCTVHILHICDGTSRMCGRAEGRPSGDHHGVQAAWPP